MLRWLFIFLTLLPLPAFAQSNAYTLNPGDIVRISAFDDERLNREVVVLPDGTLSYPVVGEIHAAGMTVYELQQQITKGLVEKGFLQDGAVIDASVQKTNGYTVYVVGQVKQPGAITSFANIDIMQAISMAGGLTPFASRSGIKVLRQADGGETVLPFDYGDVEDGEKLDSNIVLRPGDTVVVPD
jgi:polysaccharide export outer membrane protein